MARSTEEILENVVLLISFLDDIALAEVSDLPFLEMAKAVSITQLPHIKRARPVQGLSTWEAM